MEVMIGHLYRHFKGTTYLVLGVGIHTESGEEMVIYLDQRTGRIWCRPKSMFLEQVEGVPRFEHLGPGLGSPVQLF